MFRLQPNVRRDLPSWPQTRSSASESSTRSPRSWTACRSSPGPCSSGERRGSARPPSGARCLVSPGPTLDRSSRGRPRAKGSSRSPCSRISSSRRSARIATSSRPPTQGLGGGHDAEGPGGRRSRGRSGRLARDPGGTPLPRGEHAVASRSTMCNGRTLRRLVRSHSLFGVCGTRRIQPVIAAMRSAPGLREPFGLAKKLMMYRELEVGPLSADALARALRQLDGPFPRPLIKRIHEASGGNPFYALEIGRAVVRSSSRPHAGEPLPVGDDLHALLRERLRGLSPEAREALLVAAASATPSSDLVEAVTGSDVALEEAASAGIVTMKGASVEFTHPLFASAVYADAAPSTRRRHPRASGSRLHRSGAAGTPPRDGFARPRRGGGVHPRARCGSGSSTWGSGRRCRARELAVRFTALEDLVTRQRRMQSQAGNLFDAGDPLELERSWRHCLPRSNPAPPAPRRSSCSHRSPGRISSAFRACCSRRSRKRRRAPCGRRSSLTSRGWALTWGSSRLRASGLRPPWRSPSR